MKKQYNRLVRCVELLILVLLICAAAAIVALRIEEISTDPEARELYGIQQTAEATPTTQAAELRAAIPVSFLAASVEVRNDAAEPVEAAALLECSISSHFSEVEQIEPEPAEESGCVVDADNTLTLTVWREDVPLRPELQQVLLEACAEHGIDPLIMLGLIETESGFNEDIVSTSGDYGLCQLNHNYFDPNMTPEENLRAGVGLLGYHLSIYGNISAALTAYHWGHDNGTRGYASVVISKAAGWGYGNE